MDYEVSGTEKWFRWQDIPGARENAVLAIILEELEKYVDWARGIEHG